MFQECTHLVLTTWPLLPRTLGHHKTGLHPLRTGQHHHHNHLQVCFSHSPFFTHSLFIYFFFFLCATALVRSDLSASTWITSKHAIKKEKRGVLMSPSLQIKMSRNKTVFSPSCCCFSSNFGDFRLKTASPSVHQSVLHHLVPIDFSKFEDLRSFQLRFMWLLKHSSVHLFSLQC